MQKLIRWVYALAAAALLLYACAQCWLVRRELTGARVRLAELYEFSSQLREENASLACQIYGQNEADAYPGSAVANGDECLP